jgi:hypothetical protein
MLDFTTAATIEFSQAMEAGRKAERDARKWHRALRELRREQPGVLGFVPTRRRRKELREEFISALDAAHAAGMTIDAYMSRGARIFAAAAPAADVALSERANWAGLNDAA